MISLLITTICLSLTALEDLVGSRVCSSLRVKEDLVGSRVCSSLRVKEDQLWLGAVVSIEGLYPR
ncbi:hypothetical protein Taro_035283 [Colocasia esculenta]|uniref:Secreted protein n=1 Tax=Colocasia esculenta TaxID=4460 RepID=A0A843WCR4_COLES|nr:hypothetical protein [Colocasia esculenta]